MRSVLLLNVTHEPLRVVSFKRAMVLVLQDKAEIVEAAEEPVRSAYCEYPAPTVIKMRYFVKVPWRAKVPLNRKTLVARDRGTCQYCGHHGSTIDHVVPRSRGGRHEWENVVLACSPCNFRKKDRLLSEIGWELLSQPKVPQANIYLLIGTDVDPAWEPHLAVA